MLYITSAAGTGGAGGGCSLYSIALIRSLFSFSTTRFPMLSFGSNIAQNVLKSLHQAEKGRSEGQKVTPHREMQGHFFLCRRLVLSAPHRVNHAALRQKRALLPGVGNGGLGKRNLVIATSGKPSIVPNHNFSPGFLLVYHSSLYLSIFFRLFL